MGYKMSHGTRCNDMDECGLPIPSKPNPEPFTVRDYYHSDEYSEAVTIDEAIAIRGRKAFFRDLSPDDFGDAPNDGVTKVGIAELWSQSTWRVDIEDSRDVAMEHLAAQVEEGDVLFVGGLPDDLPQGENWNEVEEHGFGFWQGGTLLPFTPFHDYDQDVFFEAIDHLGPNEFLECVVRGTSCVGKDGEPVDQDFRWRVYSCKVTIYRVRATG